MTTETEISPEPRARAVALFSFLPLVLILVFATIVHLQKTIAPVDIYNVTPELYRPGNARLVKNSYVTDMVQLYLPWKFYLSQYQPRRCETNIKTRLGESALSGYDLPQGTCYPFYAARAYTAHDAFFLLAKLTTFFRAYDLSYLMLLLFIYAGFAVFFFEFLPGRPLIAILCAVLGATSFPIARDLQSDGLSQVVPTLLISLAFFSRWLRQGRTRSVKPIGLLFGATSFIFLWLSIARSSLQSLAFSPLFWLMFILVWRKNELLASRRRLLTSLCGLTLSLAAGIVYHWQAIQLFLYSVGRYLPQKGVPVPAQILKRTVGFMLSLTNFFLGDFIFSFSTIDLSKVVSNLGAREYFSYDGNSFFAGPIVALVFMAFGLTILTLRKPGSAKRLALVLVVDLAVVLLPTYRLVYFRFHAWWLLVNFILIFGRLFSDHETEIFTLRRLAKSVALFVVLILVLALVINLSQLTLLEHLAGKGYLGFENGYWQDRLQRMIMRLTFRDTYAVVFFVTLLAGAVLLSKRAVGSLIILASLSGLTLNTFFYNQPQPITPFYAYRAAIAKELALTHGLTRPAEGLFRVQPSNVNLLVNEPAYYIYESLEFPIPPPVKY